MHRIPGKSGNRTNSNQNPRAVLVMHGLLGSSADWLITGLNRSIAFLLADNGYDVWLGNARGTTYSKNHTKLSIKNSKFWDFSWHEIGVYDTSAMIDYILELTGNDQLYYVGFSQGTTQFWVLMSIKPEYNKKIKLMSALAPVAYTGHISGLLKPLSFFAVLTRGILEYIGYFEVLPNSYVITYITRHVCKRRTIFQAFCETLMFLTGGYSIGEVDHDNFATFLEVVPAGCSYKQLIHYAMGIQNPGHFQLYNYGINRNLYIYGTIEPPEYPLEKITAPVALYSGLNDLLASPHDVAILKKKLPNVVDYHTINLKRLNHFDFVFGNHVRTLVYDRLIRHMNSLQ